VSGYEMAHTGEQDKINRAFAEADLVLSCVIAENLGDVAANIAAAIKKSQLSAIGKKQNIVACENLNHASSLLEKLVYGNLDPESAEYCKTHIAFPDAIISRVVPLPENPYRIICEDYNEWYADEKKWAGKASDFPFIEVSSNLDALLERKLWIHNGGHATLGYAAHKKKCKYIHEALRDPQIAEFTSGVMHEIGDCVIHKHGFCEKSIREYEAELGRRGAIEEMRDEVRRVVRDPIRKLGLGDRIMGPLVYAYENGLEYGGLAKSVANVLCYHDCGDAESAEMKKTIETRGVPYFLENRLKLGGYPELTAKITDLRL
jgi:mannitol-1-phosphate 5-dehydrogenase